MFYPSIFLVTQRSPNDGAQLLAVLRRLLNREVRFIQWKTLGCPEIEIPRPVLSEEGGCNVLLLFLFCRFEQKWCG